VLTEVLLQRTRAEAVAAIYGRFFAKYPDWSALARASRLVLEGNLRPLGLWRRRAASLRSLAVEMTGRGGVFPDDRSALEEIPAVGQYVASAVRLFAFGHREPLLDVNMARLLERYFGPRGMADIRNDPYLQSLARKVIARGEPAALNWGMLDLGALICVPRDPYCVACPLQRDCRYASIVGVRIWAGPPTNRVRLAPLSLRGARAG
jgi:A/G-specific adenine glycosylase